MYTVFCLTTIFINKEQIDDYNVMTDNIMSDSHLGENIN